MPKRFTAALVLVVALLGLMLVEAPRDAEAQQVTSQAVLHRDTIVEGQTRAFQITNVPTRPEYYLHASVAGSFSAEASDVTITTNNLIGQALTVTPDADGPRAYPDSVYGRIRFEVTANADSDGAGDETFGVRLCTTADCSGGAVLGEWTVTITEPQADTTLSGTGATLTIAGGSALSVMEDTANGDGRDRRASFSIDVTTAPTSDIAIVAYTETGVSTGTRMAPFARINSALSPDYPPHGETGHNDVQAEYLVGYWASGTTGSQDFTIISTDNAVDSAGGTITGNLKFKLYVDNEAFRTTLSGTSSDTAYGNATAYTAIAIPDLPVRVTDDDEPTRVRLLPTSPADNEATEGATDKASVLVRLDRALVAGEEVTALLTFSGAVLGTNFTLAAQSGQTGVTYADSSDGAQGLVTLAGAGVQEGVIEVTALTDTDSDTQTLQIGMPPFDQIWRDNFHRSNLDGGVCAAHGCPDRPQGDPGQRFQSVTLAEAVPGLTITEHADPDARVVTEGKDYSYTLQLNSAPSSDVTVTTTIASGGSVQAGGTLTFNSGNYATPQTVKVRPAGNDADEPRRTLTVTHAFSGDTTYAALPDVTHEVSVLDDDATTVTMAGAGVRPGGNGSNISRIMVEGDAERVDRSLTITLSRALVDGEYVRVPLRVEAVANGNDPSLPEDPPDQGDGDPDLPSPLDPRRTTVESARGPRASANVAWPPIHNDVVMTATGTGITYEHSNRYTPNHIGFRYVEFRGAGAQTATIVVHARDGFDDGEHYDEAFAITFPHNFHVFDEETDQPLTSSPVDSNLGGGITAAPVDGEAWFGIEDDEEPEDESTIVPLDWPLLPNGVSSGGRFRLIYVTSQTTAATSSDLSTYDTFVRAEITGNDLVNGGVTDMIPYAAVFKAIGETLSTTARDHAEFNRDNAEHGNVPIYWVDGAKVADDNADFTDGDWDDEANPRHADGTAATIDTDGYWTGSIKSGDASGQSCDEISNGVRSEAQPRLGRGSVTAGLLNSSRAGLGFPLGPENRGSGCGRSTDYNHDPAEMRPMYALSGVFVVQDVPGVAITDASAAEGSAVTFTVTLFNDYTNSAGVSVPYTLADGRGVSGDPAYRVATSADYTNTAGSVTIPANSTSATFSVATAQDSTYESDHYFTVTLGTPTSTGTPPPLSASKTAIGTITDAADRPTFQFAPATGRGSEATGTAELTITKTGTTLVPSSVTWTTADGTGASGASHPGDYTSATGTLQFAPGDASKTISIAITSDSTAESAETFSVQLSDPVDATIGSASMATVTVTDTDTAPPPTVNVTLSASDGDSDGNPVEGGSGAAGYKTITVTLSRALTSGQWMQVKLNVQGATVTDDYTIDLHPSSQTGVALLTSGSDGAQNPRLQFITGGQTATLRLTPAQNNRRSQPAVSISAAIPFLNGVTAGEVTGGPIDFSIVDDESGVIEVPATFGLAPAGLSAGDRFRLIFVTSQTRTAESADIDDYNSWVQGVVARGGHAELLPYGGLVKVIGATAAVEAREQTGMWDPSLNSGSGGWADGSTSASDSGVAVYWLAAPSSDKVADNYFDFFDDTWDGGTDQSQEATNEAGAGRGSTYIWTGTFTNGRNTVQGVTVEGLGHSGSDAGLGHTNAGGNNSLYESAGAKTQSLPMFGISPVFELQAAVIPVLSFTAATYSLAEDHQDGGVNIVVTASTAPTSGLTVNLSSADGTATDGEDYTAPQATFTFPSGQTRHQFLVPITDDNTHEGDETFTLTLTAASDGSYTLGSPAATTVTIVDDDEPPVTVTMSASDGDADGNAVENGAGTTGYRTITMTLGRALTGAETVTVPLTVQGATVADDYTFGMHPATQTGVTLLNSGATYTAQNPALRFVSGGASATLRLRPVNDSDREQPYAVVGFGTDSRAPSGVNVTVGAVSGGPIGIVLVDDETGAIEVPSSWGLVPASGVGAGDDFRLLFRTSSGRDATSTDIADYDAFIRGVLATGGHADILPYAGFFKVFASTRSASGSTGTTARVHNDMTTTHTGHNPTWADSSGTDSDAAGTPTYWLNGARLANNYRDLCDQAWSGSGTGVRNGFDRDDPRSEDGTRNVPTGSISDFMPYEPWTGSGNACEAWNHPLGASTVSRGGADSGASLWHAAAAANTQTRPLYGLSPVFTVEGLTAELSVSASGTVIEGGTLTVTVTLSRNADTNLSIPVRMRTSGNPTASAADFTLSNSGNVAIASGSRSGTLTFTATDDRIDEDAETLVLEFGALPSGVVAGTTDSVSITINDNDTAGVTVTQTAGNTVVAENGGTDTYTVALNSQPLTNVVITLTSGTPAAALLSAGTQSNQATVTLTFTPSAWGAQTVTVRGVNDHVDNANDRRDVTITQSVTTGDTGGKYTTSTPVANVSVRVNDDDTAAVTITGGSLTVNEDESDTDDYAVVLGSEPLNNVTITATAPAGTQIRVGSGGTWGSSVDLEFTAGTSGNWGTAQTVTVRGEDDIIDNPGNQRAVTITHAITSGNGDGSRYTPSTPSIGSVAVTVTDDDAAPTAISLRATGQPQENGGPTTVTIRATVQGSTRFGVDKAVVVTATPQTDTASANYVEMTFTSPITINIPAGSQSATGVITVTPADDNVDELNTQVNVSGSISGDSTTTINGHHFTVWDNDAAPTSITLSVNPTSITENGGARNIAVTARVNGGTTFGRAKTVAVSVAGHNADGRVNFTAANSFNITIPAEASSSAAFNFTLTPTNNNWDEQNGAAALSGSTLGVTVTGASVTITDDDAAPTGVALSVNTSTIAEGAGATSITVTATVQGSTRYGSAKSITVSQAGSGDSNVVDYTATSPAALSIAAGAASGTTTFTITPTDDATDEFSETVTVSGSGAGVASVSEAAITLTDNDDTTVAISAPAGGIAENGGTKDVTLTLSRALVSGETVTVPLEVVGVTAVDDYTVALHPASQTGVALSTSGPDSAQRPQVTLGSGAQAAVLRFTAVDDALRQQPYAVVRYGTGARAPSATGVDFTAPTDGPVGFVLTDDETGDIGVLPSWGLLPNSAEASPHGTFRLVFVTSGQRDASSGNIADYDHFIRLHLAEGHADIIPYAGFFTVLGSTSAVTLANHADVSGAASRAFLWLGETGTMGIRRLASTNAQFRGEWFEGSSPPQQSVPRDESGALVSVAANGYFTGSTAAGGRSSNPLGSNNVTLGYLNNSGAGRDPLGSGQAAPGTATRSFYGLSPVFSFVSDPVISISTATMSVTEGTAITYTIEADQAPAANLPINLVVGDGGHVVPPAATGIKNGGATIAANTTSVTYTVNTVADSTDEPDTAVRVGIIGGSDYAVSTTTHTAIVTVTDNDAMAVSVSGGGGTVNEGSSTDYTVDPGRSLASGETVTVNFAPAGSATQGTDYDISCHGAGVTCTGLGGTTPVLTLRGGANVRRGTIRVSARTDSVHPESETAGISLRSGHAGTGSGGAFSVSGTPSTFTITSIAPAAITASFGSATYTGTEASGSRTVTIPVSLSAAAPQGGLNVAYTAHSSGTAASADYGVSPAASVSIAQGATSASITVTITDDMLHEGSETIVLDISGGSGYSPGATARTTVTITDDDAAPTTVALSVDDDAVGEGDGATTITVTATVGGSTRWGTAQTVAVSVAGSGGQGVVGFTAQPATFNISIAAGAQTGTGTFTLTPQDDNTVENAETVTVSGTQGGVTVSPATITLSDDDSAPATPVTVTLSASGGDADGNAVEGASGATGYRTITVTLGRALTGAETVTVPLTVVGATVTTDYAFALQPSSQAGVTLLTSNPHSAQNPSLRLASGASSATLRLTPVNNSVRTQPYVVVAYGTGARAPAAGGGATLGTVTGGPSGVVLVDDETGDVAVPANWGLKPSALGAGDDFRLLFRSSTTRAATSADIAVYDAFIRDVAATMGHADILPYAGFFQAFGSTRSSTGSTGTTARVHTGMAAEHTQHVPSGGWTDGSAASSVGNSGVGTPIYWLNGDILAHNYADLCDQALSSGGGVTTGWGITDPRSEDGTQNNPNSPGQAQQAWTGSGNACEAYDYPLGNSPNVSRGSSHETTWAFLHQAHSPRAEQRPLYGMSPVFKVAGGAPPPAISVGFERTHYNVREGTTLQATLTAASAPSSSAAFTVNATAGTATSGDWSGGPWSVTLPANQTSASFNVVIPSDTSIEGPERLTLTIASPPQGFTLGESTATVQIVDVNVVPGNWALAPAGLTTGQQFRLVFLGDPHPASGGAIATYDGWVQSDVSATGTTPTPHADIQAYSAGFQVVGSTAAADAAVHTGTGISESGAYAHTAWTTPIYWLGGAKIADDHNDFWDGSWDNQAATHTRGPDGQAVSGASRTWTGTQTGATHATAGTASANPLSHSGSNVTQGRWGTGNNPINQGTEGKTNIRRILAISQVFEVGAAVATPVANFANPTSTVGEASGTTNVRLSLSPAPANAITVNYTLSGTATRSTDYSISGVTSNSGTVSVSGSSTFVNIPVAITNDNSQENAETIVLTLNPGSGYNVGTTTAVHTRTITDNDGNTTPQASFAAATSSVGEASGTTDLVVNFSPVPSSNITLKYQLAGTAMLGDDYTISGGSGTSRTLSVSAGVSSVNIPITIASDNLQESSETIVVTILSSSEYARNEPLIHTRTITDGGAVTPSLSIRGGSAVTEGGSASFTISANPAPSSSITVRYTVTQSGQYVASGQLGSGKTRALSGGSTTFTIPTQDDNMDESNGSVTVRLNSGMGYNVGSPSVATVSVNDDDDDDGTTVRRPTSGGGGGGGGGAGPPQPVPITVRAEIPGELTLTVVAAAQGDVQLTINGQLRRVVATTDEGTVGVRMIVSASDRALNSLQAMQITTETASEAADADPPSGFRIAGSDHIVNIVLRGTGGRPITELTKPATVCLPLSDEIVEEAGDDPLAVLHYDDEDGWTALSDSETVTVGDERLLCAETTKFSLFAIGEPAPEIALEVAPEVDQQEQTESAPHLIGDLAAGYSLVLFSGGSVEELAAAAEARGASVVYARIRGLWFSYFLSGPDFLNQSFQSMFKDGVPALAPLLTSSETASPAAENAVPLEWPWPDVCLSGDLVPGFSFVVSSGGSVAEVVACAEARGIRVLFALVGGDWYPYFLSGPEFISDKFIDYFAEGVPVATPFYATVPSVVSDTTDETETEQQKETAERRGVIVDSGLAGVYHRDDCREDAAILSRFGWLEGDAIEILRDGTGRCADWVYAQGPDGVESWIHSRHVDESASAEPSTVAATSNTDAVVVNTANQGIALRSDCRSAARLDRTGWSEGQSLTMLREGVGRCDGWVFAQGPGPSWSWVHLRYLERD